MRTRPAPSKVLGGLRSPWPLEGRDMTNKFVCHEGSLVTHLTQGQVDIHLRDHPGDFVPGQGQGCATPTSPPTAPPDTTAPPGTVAPPTSAPPATAAPPASLAPPVLITGQRATPEVGVPTFGRLPETGNASGPVVGTALIALVLGVAFIAQWVVRRRKLEREWQEALAAEIAEAGSVDAWINRADVEPPVRGY